MSESEFHCDLCDRSFRSSDQLKKHISEHVTCGRSGCQFTAHPKVIANHVRMQHQTGIFNQIKKLDNPDEVKKWIAERKRKYPTQKNIDHQIKLEAAQKKRGEIIKADNSRFNKNLIKSRDGRERRSHVKSKSRRQKHRPMRGNSKPNAYLPVTEISCEDNLHNGDIPLFRGIGHLEGKEDDEAEVQRSTTDFQISDDDEQIISKTNTSDTVQPANKSLALLMASYESDSEHEEPPPLQPVKVAAHTSQPVAACASDDEPPTEVKTLTSTEQPQLIKVETRKRKIPFNSVDQKRQRRHPKVPVRPDFVLRPRKATLLQKLLHNQVVHDRKVILDCVRHVVRNNFLEPVQVRNKPVQKRGQAVPKKPTLLQGLLKDEIIRERNIILQCVRHVVSNNYFDSIKFTKIVDQ